MTTKPNESIVEHGSYKLIDFDVTNLGRYIVHFPGRPEYSYYSLLAEAMAKQIIYIRDDLGHAWYFDSKNKKIRCVLADLDEQVPHGENGYDCDSFEEGIRLLNEREYITGYDEPN